MILVLYWMPGKRLAGRNPERLQQVRYFDVSLPIDVPSPPRALFPVSCFPLRSSVSSVVENGFPLPAIFGNLGDLGNPIRPPSFIAPDRSHPNLA
jgi:hypothetical protein